MKIKPEHVAYIAAAIKPFDTYEMRKAYADGQLTALRYRFDLLYRAKLSPWLCDNVYPYANDDHLDTALRHILNHGKAVLLPHACNGGL